MLKSVLICRAWYGKVIHWLLTLLAKAVLFAMSRELQHPAKAYSINFKVPAK